MADRKAVASTNWNLVATWDGGTTLPGVGDVVYANGFIVPINQVITVGTLTTAAGGTVGAAAGGGFTAQNGNTVNANVVAGTTVCLTFAQNSPNAVTVNGNSTGGSVTSAFGLNNSGTGTLTQNGSSTAGSATNCHGTNNTTTGTVIQTGNGFGSPTANAVGSVNAAAGTFTATGDFTGGAGVITSYGFNNAALGSASIVGKGIGTPSNSGAPGINNASTGTMTVTTGQSNNFPNGAITQPAVGIQQNNTGGFVTVDSLQTGTGGWPPISGRHFFRAAGTNSYNGYESNAGLAITMGDVPADYPAITNVRTGTVYDFGAMTGTCAVPAAASVAFGVAVDNTTGTALIDPWSTALPGAYAAGSAGYIIGHNIDAQISTRLPTSSYTAPPSAATVAGAVWDVTLASHVTAGSTGAALTSAASGTDPWATALPGAYAAGEAGYILGTNLNATVSSRLASASYTAPPSAATIAGAVWDITLAAHVTAGSTGKALSDASSGTDPWNTSLPGAYAAGKAGYIVGNALDATVSSRLATATNAASIATIKGKTDQLAFSVANKVDSNVRTVNNTAVQGSGTLVDPWGPV